MTQRYERHLYGKERDGKVFTMCGRRCAGLSITMNPNSEFLCERCRGATARGIPAEPKEDE